MEATKPWSAPAQPHSAGSCVCLSLWVAQNPGEGDSPCTLGKLVTVFSATISPCPALPRVRARESTNAVTHYRITALSCRE